MKFGLHLFGQHDKDQSPVQNFETILDQVNTARQVGFDLVWMGHHYLVEDNQKFQPIPTLARIAADTGDMHLGTSLLLPLHHPIIIAEQFATLDVITDGKIIIAPVMGYRDIEFDSLNIDKSDRLGRLIEGVQVIKNLWTEDNVSFNGRHFQFNNVTICPQPVQDPRPRYGLAATETNPLNAPVNLEMSGSQIHTKMRRR
ncbi:LLM class flavin-dependent oxidoreductase [Halalkalicoccus salilacus]|uniref:LLM class flavin-dependent oxidoreductase n=1 Tax=Halalkalicoccus sp. GCM10025704 TaxID=3252662 RepID=UPI00361936FE